METAVKFQSLNANGEMRRHNYGNCYFRQPCGESARLVIGPEKSQTKLLDALAKSFAADAYYVLYVLLMSHYGRMPGRYQSPIIVSLEELQLFLYTFQDFFEGDGRHHVWIADPNGGCLLVYDQHDVIFAYGDLDVFESVLITAGFHEEEFWFPSPHSHGFDPANISAEDELMAYFDWQYSELQPGDEWD